MERVKPPIGLVLDHYGWDGRASGYGPWRTTRCPVHQDRHPSARVNEDEGLFRCFVCEINGDAYELVMKAEGVDFVKARELIREWTGFDLDTGSAHDSRGTGLAGSLCSGASGSHSGQRLASSKLPAWAKAKHARRLAGGGR